MLNAVDRLSPGSHDQAIRLAAWFHDAVYAPGRDDNEERSAFVAAEALEIAGASPSLISEVVRLVRGNEGPQSATRRCSWRDSQRC